MKWINHLVMAIVTIIFLFNTFLFAGGYRLKAYIYTIEQNVDSVQDIFDRYPAILEEAEVSQIDIQEQSDVIFSYLHQKINTILFKSMGWVISTLMITIALFVYLAKKQKRVKYKNTDIRNPEFEDLEF